MGFPPCSADMSSAMQSSWVFTASSRLQWDSTSFKIQSTKWLTSPWKGWWETEPLSGWMVGISAQAVWPGNFPYDQTLLSRMEPLVPNSSTGKL